MFIYNAKPNFFIMGLICPMTKERCMGKDCKFWRADAKIDNKADTFYELGTGECLFIKAANSLILR